MRTKHKAVGIGLGLAVVLAASVAYLHGRNFQMLNSAGTIAGKERHLMIVASLLSLLVVIPVFVLLFSFAWKYREGNLKKHIYTPDADGSRMLETIWWTVPTILIAIIGVMAWQSSHALDPYKTIASDKKAVNVQVVALDWKWLFIYPDEHVATINYLPLPVDTPVNFTITSDAPMNSFWIPQLGGQVYAMSGMSTQLHLLPSKDGDYKGLSANISGAGFAGMKFVAHVTSAASYQSWLGSVRASSPSLDLSTYNQLVKPSQNNVATTYALAKQNLYSTIVMKYMDPSETNMSSSDTSSTSDMSSMSGMSSMAGMSQ